MTLIHTKEAPSIRQPRPEIAYTEARISGRNPKLYKSGYQRQHTQMQLESLQVHRSA